jgi:hypothetical protein
MFKNTTAAVNNIGKANKQINAAQIAAVNAQPGNATRMANAAAGNLATANQQLNTASNQARNLGLNKVAANLKNAANKVKQAKLAEALKHTANAVKQMNSGLP